MKSRDIAMLFIILIISSCSSRRVSIKKLDTIENGKGYFVDFDATRRGSFITKNKEGNLVVLSEVVPDVAISSVIDLTSKLKVKGEFEAEQVTKITESLAQLGERTASVNILRDALYRVEEMFLRNEKIDTNDARYRLFEKILSTVKEIQLYDQLKEKNKRMESFLNRNIDPDSLPYDLKW